MSAYQVVSQTTGTSIDASGNEGSQVDLPAGEQVDVNPAQSVLAQMAGDGNIAVTRADGTKASVPASSLVPFDGSTSSGLSPSAVPYVVAGAIALVVFLYWNTNR